MSLDGLGVGGSAAVVTAILAVLGFLARKGWKMNVLATRAFVDIVGTQEQPSLRQELNELRGSIQKIDKELHPNGGLSMRDQIVRVENEIAEVRKDAAEAKQKAADAASETEGLSGAVARFHHDARERADVAGRERRGVQESLNVLLRALSEFADERHKRENAYVGALARLGIDLTNVTAELESEAAGDER